MTGFKSNAFLAHHKNLDGKFSPRSILKSSSGTDPNLFSRGGKPLKRLYSKIFIPEYILDIWTDAVPNDRCLISFLVDSGFEKHKELNVRISTDGCSLVITKKMSDIALSAKKSSRISSFVKIRPSQRTRQRLPCWILTGRSPDGRLQLHISANVRFQDILKLNLRQGSLFHSSPGNHSLRKKMEMNYFLEKNLCDMITKVSGVSVR